MANESGFHTKDIHESVLLWKYQYWKKGIPAWMFKKESMQDIKDIMDIHNAFTQKQISKINMDKLMANIKW